MLFIKRAVQWLAFGVFSAVALLVVIFIGLLQEIEDRLVPRKPESHAG